jgi:hypothetical protein
MGWDFLARLLAGVCLYGGLSALGASPAVELKSGAKVQFKDIPVDTIIQCEGPATECLCDRSARPNFPYDLIRIVSGTKIHIDEFASKDDCYAARRTDEQCVTAGSSK